MIKFVLRNGFIVGVGQSHAIFAFILGYDSEIYPLVDVVYNNAVVAGFLEGWVCGIRDCV